MIEEAIRCAICENPIKSERGCDGSCRYDEKLLKRIVDAVNGCIEADRPHGEWIYHKYDKDFECSMCHHRFDADDFGLEIPQANATWIKVCAYNFCPNCGADMRPKEGEAE